MNIIMTLRDILTEPMMKNLDVDSTSRVDVHLEILRKKTMMKSVFNDFYQICMNLNRRYLRGNGRIIEVGAGVSFIKEMYPEVLISDVVKASHLDFELDVLNMEKISTESVRAFFGINCFHHFPDPRIFFRELDRVLNPGGGVVIIDPYYGPLAKWFYKKLFDTEHFNPKQKEWNSEMGVMTGANQALSYIVFVRDRELFRREFPHLEIAYASPVSNYLRYILSGGLNFRQLLPNFMNSPLKFIEKMLFPLHRLFALHHVIVIRKKI